MKDVMLLMDIVYAQAMLKRMHSYNVQNSEFRQKVQIFTSLIFRVYNVVNNGSKVVFKRFTMRKIIKMILLLSNCLRKLVFRQKKWHFNMLQSIRILMKKPISSMNYSQN